MKTKRHRMERDSMGAMKVPRQAYWGPETQRAYENFPISGLRFPREFIKALGVIKTASAETNLKLRLLSPKLARAILRAAREVMEGKWDDHFVLDIFQTGSGTSTNMNANEVIAHRANQILGGKVGEKKPVH
jgi:fumarate hydratase class II